MSSSPIKPVSLAAAANASPADYPALTTPEQQAEAAQWNTLAQRFPELLADLNDTLRLRTYVLGAVPSATDAVVFAGVYPHAQALTKSVELVAQFRHVLRWVDLVQNTLVTVEEKVVLDFKVELPREVKKKEKKGDKKEDKKGDKKADKKEDKKTAPKEDQKAAAKGPAAELTPEQIAARDAAQKAKKEAKAKAKADQAAKAAAKAAAALPPSPAMVDFRVGFIQKAVKHPDADALYVSTIDMGDEEGPRTVCSGLVKFVPIEEMQQRYVVVIANLKPVTMRGVKLCAMVLCALGNDTVEFVNPPEGLKAGDKVYFEGFNGTPEKQLNPKKKIFETVQPKFSTTEQFEVVYVEDGKSAKLRTDLGYCHNLTLVAAKVS